MPYEPLQPANIDNESPDVAVRREETERELRNLSDTISTIEGAATALASDVADAEAAITALETDVGDLETDVAALEAFDDDFEIGVKDVNDPPTFDGTFPGDDLLTAAMLAAGAIIEYDVEGPNGFIRWEGGLQVCFGAVTATYSNANLLTDTWTYARAFSEQPRVMLSVTSVSGLGVAAQGQTSPRWNAKSSSTVALQLVGNGVFSGDEEVEIDAIAIGRWKAVS